MARKPQIPSWTSSALRLQAWVLVTLLTCAGISPAKAQTLKVLHTFTGGSDGGNPSAGLIRDTNGNLYGTAGNVVFKLDKRGRETVLHSGFASMGTLLRDAAGNLYGTTFAGGTSNLGTVFEVDIKGKAIVLHSFSGGIDGAYPSAGLIVNEAGTLYGTTSLGGAHNVGTVFKLTRSNRETVLHSFSGRDGAYPYASLIRDAKGNLYGATEYGGHSNQCAGTQTGCGVIFKLAPTGRETVLYAFTGGADGSRPMAALVRDKNGSFYGTTVAGGSVGGGTVFKLDKTGKETVLHSFTGTDGVEPSSPLVLDPKGNLYGTALDAGTDDTGTVFEIDAIGSFTVLHSFDGKKEGYYLLAGLLRDAKGNLYGVTSLGGRFGFGTAFKLIP